MSKRPTTLLGAGSRKFQPKLRVIANGSSDVNAMRSFQCGALIVGKEDIRIPTEMPAGAVPITASELPKSAKRGTLKALPRSVRTNVFIQTLRPTDGKQLQGETARRGNIATATVDLSELSKLANDPNVAYVEIGANLSAPTPDISNRVASPPKRDRWNFGEAGLQKLHAQGKDVLIGIIDVQGFDFSHSDFLDDKGKSRFVRIWDQGGSNRPSPFKRNKRAAYETFNYGSELTQADFDSALTSSSKFNLPAYQLEPQSQMDESSHGTHVASIAAGNSGVCSQAKIAAVLISLPQEDGERRRNFFDSTRLAHAVDYLVNLAKELSLPVAINISLGTNGHAHDGSSSLNRWIDSAVSQPGRCICVAAGNAGQEVAQFEGDSGFVMGRIHTSGRIASRGLTNDIEWLVVGNGIADISENELEIWYSSQDLFAVSVRPPGGDWIGPIDPREFMENRQLPDKSFVSIYNEVYNPANGCNYISVYLSPFLNTSGIVGIAAGQWTVRLHGREIKDGRYHGWIERDDPRRVGKIGDDKFAWRFPSFFSQNSMVDDSTVSSLGCGFRILSVANLDEARELINVTSSQGPTRDGRFKPDIAAPGTDIVAANGFGGPTNPWVAMTGTSMASPFVTGVAGLMLSIEPNLTAAQIEGIVQTTARPLSGQDFSWKNGAGFGRINPDSCLIEAAQINVREDKTK